jgi:hypothetical protein
MLKHVALFFICLIRFHLIQMRNRFSHEVGVIAGPVAFQSDYGQRYNLNTNAEYRSGNRIIHYINFSHEAECNCYTLILILMTTLNEGFL